MPDTIYFLAEDPIITPVGTISRFSVDEFERNHFTGLLEQESEVKKKACIRCDRKVEAQSQKRLKSHPLNGKFIIIIINHHHHHSVKMLDP